MFIDVVSVLPVGHIAEMVQKEGAAEDAAQLKLLKALRLLRLTKLLRLFRGMRIMQKYEDTLGPALNGTILVVSTVLILHTMTCLFYYVGTLRDASTFGLPVGQLRSGTGWVEHLFQGDSKYCSCFNETYYFDPLDKVCVPTDTEGGKLLKPCSTEGAGPSDNDFYLKSLYLSLQDPTVSDSYTHTNSEFALTSSYAGVLGFLWGAVAGAWTTIFAANQMASQAYRMKMSTLKEFCRIKNLDWGVRAKLTAHYEHLYPEKIIVDEQAIVDELPPKIREELVRQMYGNVVLAIPLFFGLDSAVLTEICMALTPVPALKGEAIVMEGDLGAAPARRSLFPLAHTHHTHSLSSSLSSSRCAQRCSSSHRSCLCAVLASANPCRDGDVYNHIWSVPRDEPHAY